MKGKELIINFVDDLAYLSDEKCLSLKQLDLPEIAKRFKEPASWTIRIINFKPEEKKIFAEIISYKVGNSNFSDNQLSSGDELSQVEQITFKSIDTSGLLRTLRGNSEPVVIYPRKEIILNNQPITDPENIPLQDPVNEVMKEAYSIPLKNIQFKYGCVSFDYYVKPLNKVIEFTIYNDEIREEFDAVKNYFSNVLKTKKIQVEIQINLKGGSVTSVEAKSAEISRIDKNLIESVRFEFVKAFTRKKIHAEIDKSLFTMDEFFDTLTNEKVKANTFYNNDNDLFEDLLQITDTKHYKHLRFLSSKHAHTIMKLRFVIKPFSFIFLIEGERKYHIIWETLNTEEASYIWHVDKDLQKLKLTLKKIEDIINAIKIQGKTAYISSSEDNFTRIYHDYSEMVDGFVKWKGQLESILI